MALLAVSLQEKAVDRRIAFPPSLRIARFCRVCDSGDLHISYIFRRYQVAIKIIPPGSSADVSSNQGPLPGNNRV